MTELPLLIPSTEELKRMLTIPQVGMALDIIFFADERALCPFHADTDPSIYLWEGDDGQVRWWCQPCGFGGDIFDLIQRRLGCSFGEAKEFAARLYAQLPPGYEPPRARNPRKETMDTWLTDVANAMTRAAQPQNHGLLAVRAGFVSVQDTAKLAHEWDAHLRKWGWGISESGMVYMPHWGTNGEHDLRGCKTRLGDRKGSLPGSVYSALYGAWWGRRHQDVIVFEGESDTVFGEWLAGHERIPIDVFGLPAGAGKPLTQEQVEFIGRPRRLYLCFDPDAVGVATTRHWIDRLRETVPEILVCCLPFQRDLRDARPRLQHLLAHARTSLPEPDFFQVAPGGYIRTDANGNMRSITKWTVEPLAMLSGGDKPGYDCLVHYRGTSTRQVIRLEDLATVNSLNRWANVQGMVFTGTDNDRKAVAEHVQAQGAVVPEIFQTEQVGMHTPPEHYDFAGPSYVYGGGAYVGKLPFRYAPTNRSADVAERLYLPTEEGFDWTWLEDFLALSTPDVTEPLLAWVIASMRRSTVQNFPLLFIGGSSGVGKSTLARLALRLAGSNIEVDLGANTPFILYRTLAATTSIPVFVDEWTRLSRQDSREAFQGIVPLLYTGGVAERGQADLTAMGYRMTSPVLVAGEDTFTLDRELDRTVCVFPTRDGQNKEALARLNDRPLEGLASTLHRWLVTEPDIPALDYAPAATRPIFNQQVLLAGWATLQAFLAQAAYAGEHVPHLADSPDLSCFERRHEDETENVYEQALRLGLPMKDPNGVPVVWQDTDGRGLWVRPEALIGLIETRKLDVQLPGKSRAMLGYLRERYEVQSAKAAMPPFALAPCSAHLIVGLQLQPEGGMFG